MALNFNFKDLRFAAVLKHVTYKTIPPVTVRGRKSAKGQCAAHFSILASLLQGVDFRACAMAFNDDHYIFRFTPQEGGGFGFAPSKSGKAARAGNERVIIAVPWPQELAFDETRVGCGYELSEGEFYIKYPKSNPKNQDVAMRPTYITPVKVV
jgi:hypothetical protein